MLAPALGKSHGHIHPRRQAGLAGCGIFAAGLIAASVVIVCQMVFVRYVLNDNTIWQTDFVTFSLVAATFIGAPYVLLTAGHVNVDVLPHLSRAKAAAVGSRSARC